MRVLVVGAGPAGLVTAATLGRLGVPTLLIERRATLSSLPRATGVSLRSMEIFRSWGVEDQLRAGEMDVGNTSWIGGPLATGLGAAGSLGFPTPDEAAAASPTRPAAVPQDHLEPVLLEHLRRYPSVEIRLNTELVSLNGSTAMVCSDGVASTIPVDYVVAADGAHSVVRAAVGITMQGPGDLGAYVMVTFRSPLADHLPRPRHGLYIVPDDEGMSILLPTDRRDRWAFSRPIQLPLTDDADALTARIRAATGVADLPVQIERVGTFSFTAQVAATYRAGNVFLVGDAAHRTTPRGGTGMNTAIQDGLALGWRLGWVARGWAPPELLESYEDERRPVGLRNTARSAEVGPRDSSADWVDDLAGRIPHVWLQDGRSTLDLIGSGLTLLTGPAGRPWAEEAAELGGPVPVAVHGVDAATATTLGIGRDGAVLIRPDAIPITTWPHPYPGALAAATNPLTQAAIMI